MKESGQNGKRRKQNQTGCLEPKVTQRGRALRIRPPGRKAGYPHHASQGRPKTPSPPMQIRLASPERSGKSRRLGILQSWFLFLTKETNIWGLGHGLTTLWPWASHFTSLCLSFLICKMGPYAIFLPHRGGVRIKKLKLQIIILGCYEGARSEPLSCWDARNSINSPFRA